MAGIVAVVALGTGIIFAAPAKSDPSCPSGSQLPTSGGDCYFLFIVNQNVFPIPKGQADAVIAQGKQACADMSANSGADPEWDWAKTHQVQSQSDFTTNLLFAQFAAKTYCPSEIR